MLLLIEKVSLRKTYLINICYILIFKSYSLFKVLTSTHYICCLPPQAIHKSLVEICDCHDWEVLLAANG